MNSKEILEGMVRVHQDNTSRIYHDPNGKHPKCKPGVGSRLCEYCGNDVATTINQACPSVSTSERWSVKY